MSLNATVLAQISSSHHSSKDTEGKSKKLSSHSHGHRSKKPGSTGKSCSSSSCSSSPFNTGTAWRMKQEPDLNVQKMTKKLLLAVSLFEFDQTLCFSLEVAPCLPLRTSISSQHRLPAWSATMTEVATTTVGRSARSATGGQLSGKTRMKRMMKRSTTKRRSKRRRRTVNTTSHQL